MDLLQFIDILGTFVFAITGAIRGVDKKLDIFGIFVLSFLTSVGGGTIRDILLNEVPFYFKKEYYVLPILGGVFFVLIFKRFSHYKDFLVYLDALGLGVFSVSGFDKAMSLNVGFLGSIISGLITGIGGGIVRDALVREIPLVFRKEIYATASLFGLLLFYILGILHVQKSISVWISILTIFFTRVLCYRLGINLPRPR